MKTDDPSLSRVSSDGDKPLLVMLVPHEPTLDPRIQYTADSLSKRFQVTVLATVQRHERRPDAVASAQPSYPTIRIDYSRAHLFRAVVELIRAVLGPAAPRPLIPIYVLIAIMAGAVMLPLAAVIAALWSLVSRGLWSGLRRTASELVFALSASGAFVDHMTRCNLRPAVIYCHDLWTLQAGVVMRRLLGSSLIYDSHEFYPYLHRHVIHSSVIRFFEQTLVRDVDVYITVSPDLASALARYYDVPTVHAFPNVEPMPVKVHSGKRSDIECVARGRLKVLYQGSFAEDRGLEEVLTEWEKVDRDRAVLFLRGPRTIWRDQLEAMARTRGLLGQSVYVLEPVEERDLIAAAAAADVGLIPYKGNSPAYRLACPNKLSQYVHAGIAVLANRIPYVDRLVTGHGIGMCYTVDEPGSFARVVNRLATDEAFVDGCRVAAKALSRSTYNWEHYEPAFLALATSAIPKGSPALHVRR